MALKINIEGIDKTKRGLKKRIKELKNAALDKDNINKIAEQTANDMRIRIRDGKGVKNRGDRQYSMGDKYPHSSNYTKFRQRISESLSRYTNPSRVNLSLSGQMLEAMFGKYKNKNTFMIGFKKRRRIFKYKGVRKKTVEMRTKLGNDDLAEINNKERPFLELTDKEVKKVKDMVVEFLKKELLKRRD